VRRGQRVKRKEQFRNILENGKRLDGNAVRMVYLPNRERRSRFGIIVSRKVGSAVLRNKAKRRARGIIDRFHAKISPPCDMLLFPRKIMVSLPHTVVVSEFVRLLRKAHLVEEGE
jgi:ribonuclease P protein component